MGNPPCKKILFYSGACMTMLSNMKKLSVVKKFAQKVGSLINNYIRKWCPNYHSHPLQRRSPPQTKKKTAFEEDGIGNWGITF